jgi:hypothetical protein
MYLAQVCPKNGKVSVLSSDAHLCSRWISGSASTHSPAFASDFLSSHRINATTGNDNALDVPLQSVLASSPPIHKIIEITQNIRLRLELSLLELYLYRSPINNSIERTITCALGRDWYTIQGSQYALEWRLLSRSCPPENTPRPPWCSQRFPLQSVTKN